MAFAPTDYPGLLGWYKADAIAQADNTAVASWADSGAGGVALAQATGANQPTLQTNEINGLAVVRFDGSNDCLTRALDLSNRSGLTVYAVARPAQVTASALLVEHTANGSTTTGGWWVGQNALTGGHNASWHLTQSIVTTSLSTFENWVTPILNTPHLLTARLVHGARKQQSWLFVNGNGRGNPDADTNNNTSHWLVSDTLNVGSRNNGASAPFNGDLGELLIYGHAHTPDQRIAVEAYLAARWGLTVVATDLAVAASGHSQIDGAGPTTKTRTHIRRGLLDVTANADEIVTGRNGSTAEKFAAQRYPRDKWMETSVGKRLLITSHAGNDLFSAFSVAKSEFDARQDWIDALESNATHVWTQTIPARSDAGVPVGFLTDAATVNAWVLANKPAALLVTDDGADANIGLAASTSGLYFFSDNAHFTEGRGESYLGRRFRDSILVGQLGLAAWTPALLSGLVLWLKADAITGLADNDPVSTWTDSSGSGNHATATTTLRPTYKTTAIVENNAGTGTAPAVRFNGTANGMVTPSVDLTGTSAITVFVVAAPANDTNQYVVWELSSNSSTGTTGALVERTVTTKLAAASVKGNVGSNGPSSSGTWTALGVIGALLDKTKAASSEVHQRFNGATFNSSGTNNNTNAYGNHPMYIGARGQASLFLNGDIAEILVFNRALTPGEFRQVEMHLATKYGVW